MTRNAIVVDDEASVLRMVAHILERAGWVTHTADCGAKALELLRERTCDILVTDLHMPEMTGLELIEKAREHLPDLPIVLVSGALEVEPPIDLEGVTTLPKPMKPAVLVEVVDLAAANTAGSES